MTPVLLTGDCEAMLPIVGDNTVHAVVTDPPYGLNFMGKRWDYDVPSVAVWQQCLRALKPGGYLLCFGGTRTYHRLVCRIEDAGFEIRDMIAWVYGSGFPKNRKGPWGGNALKPAHEPIVVARKPMGGTHEECWEQWGTGGLDIEGCRVPSTGGHERVGEDSQDRRYAGNGGTSFALLPGPRGGDPSGRWPANLIHDGSPEVLAAFPEAGGQLARASTSDTQRAGQNTYGTMARGTTGQEPRADAGSAARFFYCAKASRADRDAGMADAPDTVLARSCQAQADADRGVTVDSAGGAFNKARIVKNNHPTVKPTDLMRYLCRLVTPAGGIVLDPFMGSGSTGRGALLEGFGFIGIEREPEYLAIAEARIADVTRRAAA